VTQAVILPQKLAIFQSDLVYIHYFKKSQPISSASVKNQREPSIDPLHYPFPPRFFIAKSLFKMYELNTSFRNNANVSFIYISY